MKKFMVSFLIFATMIGTIVANADSVSLIGKKVQSEAVVNLDGVSAGSAIIIDGVSYAPVRVIAEASNLTVGYKKGVITLTSNESENTEKSVVFDEVALNKEKRQLTIRVNTLRNYISDTTHSINEYTSVLENIEGELIKTYEAMIAEFLENKQTYETELRAAELRIAEIDELLK
jgi:hypothetical protein